MKKGISLIVLVITIIVMIIIAAAVIVSINQGNIIAKANEAVSASNLASARDALEIEYANRLAAITPGEAIDYDDVKEKAWDTISGDYSTSIIYQNGTLITAAQ